MTSIFSKARAGPSTYQGRGTFGHLQKLKEDSDLAAGGSPAHTTSYERMKKSVFWFIWGSDLKYYNTVVDTGCVPFWIVQLFRMVSFLMLLVLSAGYFYIYVRKVLIYYQTLSLFSATLAFYFLFVGSGK